MKFHRKPRRDIHLDLTALLDVVFLLLFFLMVTSSFIDESRLIINLPKVSTDIEKEETGHLTLTINKLGEYALDNASFSVLNQDELIAMLAKQAGQAKDQVLLISADAETSHQSVVKAMEAAARVGLSRVAISAEISTQEQ